MLTQEEADALINALKNIKQTGQVDFPVPNCHLQFDAVSEDGKHTFVIDVNRKGYCCDSRKCTYQERFQKDTILIRLDINGPEHTNPDGVKISGNHVHIYRAGFSDKFAIEIPGSIHNDGNLIDTLIDFFEYIKIQNADQLQIQEVI